MLPNKQQVKRVSHAKRMHRGASSEQHGTRIAPGAEKSPHAAWPRVEDPHLKNPLRRPIGPQPCVRHQTTTPGRYLSTTSSLWCLRRTGERSEMPGMRNSRGHGTKLMVQT